MSKSNQFEYLVFSGGGAKGILYPGAYMGLKQSGTFKNVKMLAGSSVGALLSALMASGISPLHLKDIAESTDFRSVFLDDKSILGLLWSGCDGNAMEDFIRTQMKQSILDFFNAKSNQTDEFVLDLLQRCSRFDTAITFTDLAQLHRRYPEIFKPLIVTAVEKNTGDLQIFSEFYSPDEDVALACLASAALPIVFQPANLSYKNVFGEKVQKSYIDGGYFDNLPTDDFILPFMPDDQKGGKAYRLYSQSIEDIRKKTLIFALGNNDPKHPLYRALYSSNKTNFVQPGLLKRFLFWVGIFVIAGIRSVYDYFGRKNAMYQRIQRYYRHNTVALDSLAVGTIDFDRAKKDAKKLFYQGYFTTCDFLEDSIANTLAYQMQRFFFECFKEYQSRWTFLSPYRTEIQRSHKARLLARFFENEKVEDLTQQIRDYVRLCSYDRQSCTFSSNTRAIKSFLKVFNSYQNPQLKAEITRMLVDEAKLTLASKDIQQYIQGHLSGEQNMEKAVFYRAFNAENQSQKKEP